MFTQKGFTLIQLIVVLVIVGVLSAIAIPSYVVNVQTGYAKAACNNLNVIANAQKTYYLNNGHYCTGTNNSTCGDNTADLDTNLNLSISDSKFSYACALTAPTGFLCTATINTGNTLVTIPMPSNSFQLLSAGGSNTAIQVSGGCVPTVPCSGANNCSTDSCGTSCGTCSGAGVTCSSNVAGTPGQCKCTPVVACGPASTSCGNDSCGNLCGNCKVPPDTCTIPTGSTVGTCTKTAALCAPGTCGVKDANGNACTCPDSTYSCNASHQCYQCPDLPANTSACPNNLNQSSTVYTVVPNCSTPGVCQALCPFDPSGKNGPGFYNIVGGTECVLNPQCGPSTTAITCAVGVPINEGYDHSSFITTWNCKSGSVISAQCSAPAQNFTNSCSTSPAAGTTATGDGFASCVAQVPVYPYSNCSVSTSYLPAPSSSNGCTMVTDATSNPLPSDFDPSVSVSCPETAVQNVTVSAVCAVYPIEGCDTIDPPNPTATCSTSKCAGLKTGLCVSGGTPSAVSGNYSWTCTGSNGSVTNCAASDGNCPAWGACTGCSWDVHRTIFYGWVPETIGACTAPTGGGSWLTPNNTSQNCSATNQEGFGQGGPNCCSHADTDHVETGSSATYCYATGSATPGNCSTDSYTDCTWPLQLFSESISGCQATTACPAASSKSCNCGAGGNACRSCGMPGGGSDDLGP